MDKSLKKEVFALSTSFSRAVAVTSIIGLGVGGFLFQRAYDSLTRTGSADSVITRLAHGNYLGDARSAADAKQRGLFWGIRQDTSEGVALDWKTQPKILHALFPGYPEAFYSDENLWEEYFQQEFNPASWLQEIGEVAGTGIQVIYSWTGCFDIFKKYGADIIVIGNSESYFSISPDLLAQRLREAGLPKLKPPRVLMCATSYMLMDQVRDTARLLEAAIASGQTKAKLVVWSFSYWTMFLRSSEFPHFREDRSRVLSEYQKQTNRRSFLKKPKDALSKLGWGNVLAANVDDLLKFWAKESGTAPVRIPEEGGIIDAHSAENDATLEAAIQKIRPFYHSLKTAKPEDCELSEANRELDQSLLALSRIADRTLVYLSPTTPLHLRSGPDCLYPNVRKVLQSKASGNVITFTGDWKEFSLNYRHFLFPTDNRYKTRVDVDHTNAEGARLVTEKLVTLISKTENK